MKKYKLLTQEGYPTFKFMAGNIYPENWKYNDNCYTIAELVQRYPNDWKLVEDDFVLPEKWCIAVTKENIESLGKWREAGSIGVMHSNNPSPKGFIHSYNKGYWSSSKMEGYTKITFDQFKKYVLNMKEEKEIIGYKLKESCNEYFYAVKELNINFSVTKSMEVSEYPTVINNLKKAGVLDLWFEPVYKQKEPEYKIGDFVKVAKKGYDASQFNRSSILGVYSNKNWENEVYTISSKPKFYDGEGYVKNDWVYELKNSKDEVAGNVYSQALRKATEEEIKAAQTPQITINGYTGEFFDWGVKFGCAEITKEDFDELYTCIENFGEGQRTNKLIQSVTIGKGTFSKEQIKEIATYYLNKEK